jgi:hypothetical protein
MNVDTVIARLAAGTLTDEDVWAARGWPPLRAPTLAKLCGAASTCLDTHALALLCSVAPDTDARVDVVAMADLARKVRALAFWLCLV